MKHFVIDIETLGVSQQSVVLSIGAVEFDPKGQKIIDEFYQELRLEDQVGRMTDIGTVRWWIKQIVEHPERASIFLNENRCPVRNALNLLREFLGGFPSKENPRCIWACDPDFDLSILNNLYSSYQLASPWAYYEGKSIRTIRHLTDDLFSRVHFEKTHNSLEDCVRQAKEVMHFYQSVGSK